MHESWKSWTSEAGYKMDLSDGRIFIKVTNSDGQSIELTEEQMGYLTLAYDRFRKERGDVL